MKLTVVIPTRDNHHRLNAVLTALDHLASGQHEIEYHLIVDHDDMAYEREHVHSGDPAVPVNVRLNEMARTMNADAITILGDDVFPLALHWDALIAIGIEKGLAAFAWQELTDPQNVTYPILSRKWIEATGRVFSEYFPFWFADTWLSEVHDMAFGQGFPIVQNLPLGGKRGPTRGMHDLRFWFDFFEATHHERQEEARLLAKAFHSEITLMTVHQACEAHHARYLKQIENIPHYEKMFGADAHPPSDRYRHLKAAAERWLNDHQPGEQRVTA